METKKSRLMLANKADRPVLLFVEPWPELHTLQPGQDIEIEAEYASDTRSDAFSVVWSDEGLVIYPPGTMDEFVDCTARRDGITLQTEE